MKKINYPSNINTLYLSIFTKDELNNFQNEWDQTLKLYPELKILSPKIEKILTADFKKITEIYFAYQEILEKYKKNNNGDNVIKKHFIRKKSKKTYIHIFDYGTFYPRIISFFCRNIRSMGIYSCFYCDIHPVGKYAKKNTDPRLTLDLDHFYPKDQCPILALSLRNFVPSCQVCNSRMKGKTNFLKFYQLNTIKDVAIKKKILNKLSPTSEEYDFENNSIITVDPTPGFISTSNYLQNFKIYKIKINTDTIYKHEKEALLLEQRYNSITILSEALSILDLKQKYPQKKIKEIAHLFENTKFNINEDTLEELIFRKKFDENRHSNLMKLKNDLLK